MMWQLCINGIDGKNHVVKIKSNEPEKTTVAALKELVRSETGIDPEHQRLLYGAKQMEDRKRLCDYPPLGNGANILLVLRLPGGGAWNSTPSQSSETVSASTNGSTSRSTARNIEPSIPHSEKVCASTNESTTIRKIDPSVPRSDEDCIIYHTSGDCVKMPCGHTVSPDGLMDYCWSEIEGIKVEIKCPLCPAVWSLDVIKRYGGASETEMQQLEIGLARNSCIKDPNIQKCPTCGVFCERLNPTANSVSCILCKKEYGEDKVFCWICLGPWKSSSLTAKSCGNDQCDVPRQKLRRLLESPQVTVGYINPPMKMFKLRACPKCAIVIEFTSGCKQMTCTNCKTDFCFICLRKRTTRAWPCGNSGTRCELAPIQTVLPK